MRKEVIFIISLFITISSCTNKDTSVNNEDVSKETATIRLLYPQWQGGSTVGKFITELPADDANRGYYLGAQLLNFLAPESSHKTVEVPVPLDINDRVTENGMVAYKAILKITRAALEKVQESNPERIVTLGGECSVSVVPFSYLAAKYPDDVAVVWLDAHPDLNLPNEDHMGYHAMALSACMGKGDKEIMNLLPGKVDASKVLLVGLRSWKTEGGTKERQQEWGVKHLSPTEVAENSLAVIEWLKSTGASKVAIHFDLDVLDPTDLIAQFAAFGIVPDGMKTEEVVRIVNDISAEYDVVGLTIAEPLPKVAIKIKNMLNELPLLKD